jgi:hypothetical protein
VGFIALSTAERKANLTPAGVLYAPTSILSPSAADSTIANSPARSSFTGNERCLAAA